jgi:hypothetical protein
MEFLSEVEKYFFIDYTLASWLLVQVAFPFLKRANLFQEQTSFNKKIITVSVSLLLAFLWFFLKFDEGSGETYKEVIVKILLSFGVAVTFHDFIGRFLWDFTSKKLKKDEK